MTDDPEIEFAENVERFIDEMKILSPPYFPNRFEQMIKKRKYNYVAAVEELMMGYTDAHGFCELLRRNALRLVMENLVVNPKYASLFCGKSKEMAKWRLENAKEYCEIVKNHPQNQS